MIGQSKLGGDDIELSLTPQASQLQFLKECECGFRCHQHSEQAAIWLSSGNTRSDRLQWMKPPVLQVQEIYIKYSGCLTLRIMEDCELRMRLQVTSQMKVYLLCSYVRLCLEVDGTSEQLNT